MKSEFRSCGFSVAYVCLFLATILLSPWTGFGQSVYGTIAGSVTDSTQAAVVGAQVVATNPATGFTRDTSSNSTGVYTVPNLLPGTYNVTITAPGFQTYTRTEVRSEERRVGKEGRSRS